MPGPWEKYQSQPAGPWNRYAQPAGPRRRDFRIPKIGWEDGGPTFGTQSGVKGPGDQLAVDAIEGFNRTVASVLDAPEMLVRSVMKTVGAGNPEPEMVTGMAAKLFKQYGITDPEAKLNPIMEDLGTDAIAAIFGLGAASKLSKLAPRAVDAGASMLTRFSNRATNVGQKVGAEIMANPGAAAISEAGASLGGSSLAQQAKGTGWENTARTVGSVVGGGLTSLKATTGMTRRAVPDNALLGQTRDPSLVTQYAEEALTAERTAIEEEISNMVTAIARPDPNVDPQTANRTSARLATRITRQANNRARGIEDGLWTAASVDRPMDNQPLQAFWQNLVQQWSIPGAGLMPPELARLGRRIERLAPEGMLSDQVGQRSIRSEALAVMRRAASSRDGGGILTTDMNAIQTHIIDGVRAAYPDDEPLRQAHEWSIWRNDRFERPESRLRPFVEGVFDEQDHPKLIRNLLSHSSGGEAVAEVSTRLQFTRLVATYQRNIRDQFISISTNWGKQGRSPAEIQQNRRDAADWLSKPETRTFMRDLPTEMADTHLAANHLVERLDARDQLATGAFNRIAGTDIDNVAQQVLQTGDKAAAVREIMEGIARARPDNSGAANDLARNGFQAEVINRLFASAQYDPSKLHQMMGRQDYQKMLHELLPGRALDDFMSIVKDAMSTQRGSIALGDTSRVKAIAKAPATVASRILGARLGAGLGTGTIQAPAVGSGFLGSIAEKYFSQIDPKTALGRAVIDPHFRKLLHATIPRNRREHGQLFRAVTLAASVATAALHKYEDDKGISFLDPSIRPKVK